MTLDQLIIEVFDNLGRPTDLTPLDQLDDNDSINSSLPGYKQLQRWINLGYEAVTKWRTPNGRFFRSRDMVKRKYCQFGPHTIDQVWEVYNPDDPAFDSVDKYQLTFPSDSYYVGYVPPDLVWVTFTGLGSDIEFQEVEPPETTFGSSLSVAGLNSLYQSVYQATDADYVSLGYYIDANTIYLLNGKPWIIDTTEVKVYEKGIYYNRFNQPNTQIVDDLYAIRSIRVIDPVTQSDSELANRTQNFTDNYANLGRPTAYYREKKYIYFDWHLPQKYTFQLEYYQQITPLVNGNDSPLIQERYHTPIVYWATYRGLLRFGENNDAYSMFRFLDTEMRSIIKEQDLDVERLEGGFTGGFSGHGAYGAS